MGTAVTPVLRVAAWTGGHVARDVSPLSFVAWTLEAVSTREFKRTLQSLKSVYDKREGI
jgi:hypothetical protein